jgi:hypothetical protein
MALDLPYYKTATRALDRMKAAFEAGKGVRLSWEELSALSVSSVGEAWNDTPSEYEDVHNNFGRD